MASAQSEMQLSGSQQYIFDSIGVDSLGDQSKSINDEKIRLRENSMIQKRKKFFIARKIKPSDLKNIEFGDNDGHRRHSTGILDRSASVKSLDALAILEGLKMQGENLESMKPINEESNVSESLLKQISQSPKKLPKISSDKHSQFLSFGGGGGGDQNGILSSKIGNNSTQNQQFTGLVSSKNFFSSSKTNLIDEMLEQSIQEKNIFEKSNASSIPGMQNGEYGPKKDNRGKLVPRSLVGKPEWFEKNQRSKLTKEDLNNLTSKKQSRFTTNPSVSVQSKGQKQLSSKSLIKAQVANVRITKFQLEKQIDEIRQRIHKNIEQERKHITSLNTTDLIRYTHQERTIKKYEDTEKNWMEFIDLSSSKLNRDFSSSVLLKSDYYRQKKEMIDVFETVKGPFDKYGQRVWYMNLRQSNNTSQQQGDEKNQGFRINSNPLVVLEDMPLAFNKALTSGPVKRQLEIVRKPLLTNLNASMKISSSQSQSTLNHSFLSSKPFSTFDSLDYYNQRINEIKADFKFNKKILIEQQTDVDNLAVVGISQLQKEEDMLLHSVEDLFDHHRLEPEQYVEEIIEQNYDKFGIQQEGGIKDFKFPPIHEKRNFETKDTSIMD